MHVTEEKFNRDIKSIKRTHSPEVRKEAKKFKSENIKVSQKINISNWKWNSERQVEIFYWYEIKFKLPKFITSKKTRQAVRLEKHTYFESEIRENINSWEIQF